jgi:DNA ligase D-like protein (predicted ligase)
MSRNKLVINDQYPELVDALLGQPSDQFVLDGEIVAARGVMGSFAKLQQRMHVTPDAGLIRRVPVVYEAFDVLYLDGYDLTRLDLLTRKALLTRSFTFRARLRYLPHRLEKGLEAFQRSCRSGWEGVIAKRADARYLSGRSGSWLKFKCGLRQFVIGGYTEPQGQRKEFGALLLGYYEGGALRYAGKVGTGYAESLLSTLAEQLRRLERPRSPFADPEVPAARVHWVKPELVAEVDFAEWTKDGRLRHPSFAGLRRDKPAGAVLRERPAPPPVASSSVKFRQRPRQDKEFVIQK